MLTPSAAHPVGAALLAASRQSFRTYKALSDRALVQLTDAEWLYAPVPGSNSAAGIVQHLAGSLNSRFTDFLSLIIPRGQSEQFNQPMTGTR